MEKPYTKVTEGYDTGVGIGPAGPHGDEAQRDARALSRYSRGLRRRAVPAAPGVRAQIDTSTPAIRSAVNHSAADQTVIAISAASAAPSSPKCGTSSILATSSDAIDAATAGRLA